MTLPKNFKIKNNNSDNLALAQKLLFSKGYGWTNTPHSAVKHLDSIGIVIRNKTIFYSQSLKEFNSLEMPELNYSQLKRYLLKNSIDLKYLL